MNAPFHRGRSKTSSSRGGGWLAAPALLACVTAIERRSLLLAALLGGSALAFGAGCRSKPSAKASAPTEASASSTSLRFDPAHVYVYALDLQSEVEYGENTKLGLALKSAVEVHGGPSAADVLTLDVRLPEPHFAETPGAESQFAELSAELRRGFAIVLERGKLKELRSVGPVSPFAGNILRSVAAGFELPAPQQPGLKSWVADSEDAAGKYSVELQAQSVPGQYGKRKLRYLETAVQSPGDAAFSLTLLPRIIDSRGELTLRDGIPTSSHYEEHLDSELGSNARASAHNRLALTFEASKPGSPAPLAATTRLGSAVPSVAQVDRSAMDAAKVGTFSFDSALARLRQDVAAEQALLATDKAQPESASEAAEREQRLLKHNQAFSALTSILRTQPEVIPRASALIRSGASTAKMLLDALAAADTPRGNAALLELTDDSRTSAGLRAAAAQDLTRIETPTAETLHALLRLMERPEYALIAVYGLGTQARHLKQQGKPELAELARRALLARLARAPNDEARVHVLRGIANSGLSASLPQLKPLLSDSSVMVRGAAVEALRLMDDPEVDALIAGRLSEEKDHFALAAALAAAKARAPSPTLNAAVIRIATSDPNDRERYAAIGLLVRWLPKVPSLREPLTRIASNDSVEALRNAARTAL